MYIMYLSNDYFALVVIFTNILFHEFTREALPILDPHMHNSRGGERVVRRGRERERGGGDPT